MVTLMFPVVVTSPLVLTVMIPVPHASLILPVLMVSRMSGVTSLSVMVTTPVASVIVPVIGLLIITWNVSSHS